MHYHGQGGQQDLVEARRLFGLAAAQGHAGARSSLRSLERAAKAQRAKQQADADAMMAQLLAEESEGKKAKGAAKSAKGAKKARRRPPAEPAAAASVVTDDHKLEAGDTGVEATVQDSGDVVQETSPAAEPTTAHPTAMEPLAPFIEAGAAASVPVAIGAIGATGRGRGGRAGPARGRGGQRVQSRTAALSSTAALATGDGAVCAVAHLLGQASLQVPAGSFDVGAMAAAVAPTAVTSLADAQFHTGRPEAPESTIGGQSTCIVCFTNPKSHAAVPCGHQLSLHVRPGASVLYVRATRISLLRAVRT